MGGNFIENPILHDAILELQRQYDLGYTGDISRIHVTLILTSEGRLTIEISQPKDYKEPMINAMQKGGIDSMTSDELIKIISEAEKVYDKISLEVEKKIKNLAK